MGNNVLRKVRLQIHEQKRKHLTEETKPNALSKASLPRVRRTVGVDRVSPSTSRTSFEALQTGAFKACTRLSPARSDTSSNVGDSAVLDVSDGLEGGGAPVVEGESVVTGMQTASDVSFLSSERHLKP